MDKAKQTKYFVYCSLWGFLSILPDETGRCAAWSRWEDMAVPFDTREEAQAASMSWDADLVAKYFDIQQFSFLHP